MKRKTLLTAAFLLIACKFLDAQSLRYPIAMPYSGLTACSNYNLDVFSFKSNQAALAKIPEPAIGLYSEKRFMMAQLGYNSLVAALPTNKGNFGMVINYAGFSNFNETQLGIAYAKSLGSRIDLGVQFNYYKYRIPGYFNAAAINGELGAIIHLTEKLNAGFHFYNPIGGKINSKENNGLNEKLPSAYKLGFGYDASENVYLGTEIIKEEGRAINIVTGIQYHFQRQFFFRAGFMSESKTVFAGAGLAFKNLRLDISGSYHPVLGISPGVMLIANFKNKTNKN